MASQRDKLQARIIHSAGWLSRKRIMEVYRRHELTAEQDLCAVLAQSGLLSAPQVDWIRAQVARSQSSPKNTPRRKPATDLFPDTSQELPGPTRSSTEELDPDEVTLIDPNAAAAAASAALARLGKTGWAPLPPPLPNERELEPMPPPPPGILTPPAKVIDSSQLGLEKQATEEVALEVGPYLLMHKLGEGGMGVVYEAYHQGLKSRVALKMILAEEQTDPKLLERFELEAQAMARFEHPNIVRVRDVKLDGRLVYMAMDLVKGENLMERLERQKPLPREEAVGLAVKIADALQHAHERGVVHRDLKPSNILITEGGEPLLTDFGLAKPLDNLNHDLTATNDIVGTPAYTSPEQLETGEVDPRSDVYSLASTLFEMLTGQAPFGSGVNIKIISRVLTTEAPKLRSISPQLPADLEAIVAKALEKDPARRFQSAAAIAEALRRHLASPAPVGAPPPLSSGSGEPIERGKLMLVTGLAATLLLAFTGALTWALIQRGQVTRLKQDLASSSEAAATFAAERAQLANENDSRQRAAAAAEAARAKAAAALAQLEAKTAQGQARLTFLEADRIDEQRRQLRASLARTEQAWRSQAWDRAAAELSRALLIQQTLPAGSAPGLTRRARRLARLGLERGRWLWRSPTNLPEPCNDVAYAPSGAALAAAVGAEVRVWEADSGRELAILTGHDSAITRLAFAPDERRLASAGRDGSIRLWDLADQEERRRFTSHRGPVLDLAFRPGRRELVSCGEDGRIRFWDLETGAEVSRISGNRSVANCLAFSPDGAALASGSIDGTIELWDSESGKRRLRIKAHDKSILDLAFSPDGRRLASASRDQSLKLWDPSSGDELQSLGPHPAPVLALAWDPAGARIATGAGDGLLRLFDLQGATEPRVLPGHDRPITGLAFAPEGGALVSCGRDRRIIERGRDGEARRGFIGHREAVVSLVLAPGSLRSLSADGQALLWSRRPGEAPAEDDAPRASALPSGPDIGLAAPFADGQRFAIARARDAAILVVDAVAGQVLKRFRPFDRPAQALLVAADGGALFAAGDDIIARIDLSSDRIGAPIAARESGAACLALSSDGATLASGGAAGAIALWDAVSGAPRGAPTPVGGPVRSLAFGPDGALYVGAGRSLYVIKAGGEAPLAFESAGAAPALLAIDGGRISGALPDRSIALWDLDSRRLLERLRGPRAALTALVLQGEELASADESGALRLWSVPRLRVVDEAPAAVAALSSARFVLEAAPQTLVVEPTEVKLLDRGGAAVWSEELGSLEPTAAAVCADQPLFALGFGDGRLRVYDRGARRMLRELRGHEGAVTGLAFTAAGRFASVGVDGLICFWEPGQERPKAVPAHRGAIRFAAALPGGQRLITVGDDRRLCLWSCENTFREGELQLGSDVLTAVALDPKGRGLIVGTLAGALMIWDLKRPQAIERFEDLGAAVLAIAFSGDGRLFAVADARGDARLYDAVERLERRRWPAGEGLRGLAFLGPRLLTLGDKAALWDSDSLAPPLIPGVEAPAAERLQRLSGLRSSGARLRPASACEPRRGRRP